MLPLLLHKWASNFQTRTPIPCPVESLLWSWRYCPFKTHCVPVSRIILLILTVIFLQTFWEDVRQEMIEEKGLDPVAADKIGNYVQMRGGPELIEQLLQDSLLPKSKAAVQGLEAMKLLLKYCDIFGILDKVCRV